MRIFLAKAPRELPLRRTALRANNWPRFGDSIDLQASSQSLSALKLCPETAGLTRVSPHGCCVLLPAGPAQCFDLLCMLRLCCYHEIMSVSVESLFAFGRKLSKRAMTLLHFRSCGARSGWHRKRKPHSRHLDLNASEFLIEKRRSLGIAPFGKR